MLCSEVKTKPINKYINLIQINKMTGKSLQVLQGKRRIGQLVNGNKKRCPGRENWGWGAYLGKDASDRRITLTWESSLGGRWGGGQWTLFFLLAEISLVPRSVIGLVEGAASVLKSAKKLGCYWEILSLVEKKVLWFLSALPFLKKVIYLN